MRRTLVAIAVLAAAAAVTPAQDERAPEDVSALVAEVRSEHPVPALGGAIVDLDGLAAVGVAGVRVQGGEEAVTADDLWHLGSCTKAMTATLLAKLHEKERLALDTTLADAFPALGEAMHEDWRDVPLSWLLRNRGGAPASLGAGGLWSRLRKLDGPPRDARALLTSEVLATAPASEPGTTYTYSNAGFAITGHAAETREDAAWEDLLRREVFEPLGMEDAGFGPPGDAKRRDQPFGHRPMGEGALPIPPGPRADNPPAIGPAGTVHATLADWARFVRLHLRGARGEEGLLLRPPTFETLHRPPEGQTYAMGWSTGTRAWASGEKGVGRVLTHAGSNTMWFCVVWIAPERGFALLATCNLGGDRAAKACDALVGALLRRHLGQD